MDRDLYNAARSGDVSFLKTKEDIETLVSQVTPKRNSVLHLAAESDQLEFFREAARLCPSLVKHANSKGDTPLHFAVRAGSTEVVKLIITEHPKKPPSSSSDIEEGHDVEGLKELLRIENLDGDNALHLAARYTTKSSDAARLLIEADPQLSTILTSESSILARKKPFPSFSAKTKSYLQSACFIALANRNKYVAGVLLSCTNPSCSLDGDINGMTALHVATVALAQGKHVRSAGSIRTLLHTTTITEGGLDDDLLGKIVDAAPKMILKHDDIGWTPLHYAAYFGISTVVELFLKKDRSAAYILDKQDKLSALHIAACVGEVESMRALLAACPDCVDLVDKRGRNALHAAVLGRQEVAVRFMLSLPGTLYFEAGQDGKIPVHLEAMLKKKETIPTDTKEVKDEIFEMRDEQQQAKKRVKDALSEEPTRPMIDASSTKDGRDREADFYNYLQLSATLIATVTFTAAFTIPGGFIQSGGKDEGMAVLTSKPAFKVFIIFDVLAFFASFAIIVMLLMRGAEDRKLRRRVAIAITAYFFIAYVGLALAFTCGLYVVLGNAIGFSVVVLVISIIATYFGWTDYVILEELPTVNELYRLAKKKKYMFANTELYGDRLKRI